MTTVYHIETERTWCYTISPAQAVICAYEQQVNGNWNTWTYHKPETYTGYQRTKNGHLCNGFWAKA